MTSPIPQPNADRPNTAGGVVASSVTVGYGQRTIIRDLSATFPAGKITTIVGPNGCGKSTLLRAMSGLLNLDTGTVSVDGQNISDMKRKDVARILGMLPQSPVASEGLLVSDLVARAAPTSGVVPPVVLHRRRRSIRGPKANRFCRSC